MVRNPPTLPGDKGRVRGAARGASDQRRSTCSRCRMGIFTGQDAYWSHDPLGLVHRDCPDLPGGVLLDGTS